MYRLAFFRLRTLLPAGLVALFSAAADETLHAQRGRATLDVTVTVANTGEPIAGARVTVDGTRALGITDEAGAVRLTGLPAGAQTVEVRMLGLASRKLPVTLADGAVAALEARMELAPVELQAVRVEAEMRSRGTRMLTSNGFFDRRTLGMGSFITRNEIERMNARFLSDVLRRSTSMKLQSSLFRMRTSSRRQQQGICQPMFYVNGLPVLNFQIDEMRPEDVEGIEVYDGAADAPALFTRGGTGGCGVIVLWTRIN